MKFKIIPFLALSFCSSLYAASYSGTVEMIQSGPNYNGVVFVKVDGTVQNKPTCSNNSTWDFAFDGNSDSGKTMLSLLLSAHATGKNVGFYGKNACTHWDSVENLGYVNLK